jgi:heme exporter protein A
MTDHDTAIQVSSLWKRLGGRIVLRDVNFTLRLGEIVALTGANGAGKTTLLRCLASVLRPCAGHIRWLNQATPPVMRLRRWLGYAGHDTFLYPHLTAEENLVFAARMYAIASPTQHVHEQLENAGLDPVRHVLASRLSPGTRRRLSILRAVVHAPTIVLLDEPSSGLDAQGQQWLIHQLQRMQYENRCICFVTHDEALVGQLADRVMELNDGRVEQRACARPVPRQEPAARKQAA